MCKGTSRQFIVVSKRSGTVRLSLTSGLQLDVDTDAGHHGHVVWMGTLRTHCAGPTLR